MTPGRSSCRSPGSFHRRQRGGGDPPGGYSALSRDVLAEPHVQVVVDAVLQLSGRGDRLVGTVVVEPAGLQRVVQVRVLGGAYRVHGRRPPRGRCCRRRWPRCPCAVVAARPTRQCPPRFSYRQGTSSRSATGLPVPHGSAAPAPPTPAPGALGTSAQTISRSNVTSTPSTPPGPILPFTSTEVMALSCQPFRA